MATSGSIDSLQRKQGRQGAYRLISHFGQGHILCPRPAVTLIALFPLLLGVSQALLNPGHLFRVTGVLAQVITELDSGTAIRSGDFDDDVERLGLFAAGLVGEVI